MKLVLTILLVLSIGVSFAISEYSCMFLAINPSNISRALGYGNIGVVDVWHNNPLTSYSNPAIVSLHEGISYGYTHENWLKGSGIADLYYDVGLVNIGYKGIGVILPAPNSSSNPGINLDYGSQEHYDENGNLIDVFHAEESAAVYGLSVNLSEFLQKTENPSPLFDYLDLAIGAERVLIRSDLGPGLYESESPSATKAACLNLGLIARIHYKPNNNLKLEGVYGTSFFNAFKEKISYINADYKDIIYRGVNHGLALSFSVLSENLLKDVVAPEFIFFDNILSARFFTSVEDNFTDDENPVGSGIEIGFLDTFFIRRGHYRDRSGHIVGDTKGYGINLHYKNLFEYSYNSSTIPGGDLVSTMKSSDQTFMLNIFELYKITTANK